MYDWNPAGIAAQILKDVMNDLRSTNQERVEEAEWFLRESPLFPTIAQFFGTTSRRLEESMRAEVKANPKPDRRTL